MNNLQDQLRNLFPEHSFEENTPNDENTDCIWLQDEPLLCKYEKRHGKAHTIIEGYTGATKDFKQLTQELKISFGVGGTFKNDTIILQTDKRDQVMDALKQKGFKVKRVGG